MKYKLNELVYYNDRIFSVKNIYPVGQTYAYILSNGEYCFERSLKSVNKNGYYTHTMDKIRENFTEILNHTFNLD